MILSMTGFGKAAIEIDGKKIIAEVKSLNSKQLDLSVKLPQIFREKELEVRNLVSKQLERGKVDLSIYFESNSNSQSVTINLSTIKEYKAQFELMSRELNIPEPQDWYATLLRMPDIMKTETVEINADELEAVIKVAKSAIEQLCNFRQQEGENLSIFFNQKIANIRQLLSEVEPYEGARIEKVKTKILTALEKLGNIDYDKNRFEQELIYYIEKLDINEEKQRLNNHLNYFIQTLEGEHGQGKKLGFITQEMGREINTLGSKANHLELQRIVVQMKDELEQIKEQILNVM
ncbi:MAG: YicC/YloC family endoribonuclease [Bacteroidales bacterium]